jgi:hypothetical protein
MQRAPFYPIDDFVLPWAARIHPSATIERDDGRSGLGFLDERLYLIKALPDQGFA